MASTAAFGQRPTYSEHGVLDDTAGIRQVRDVAVRVVEVARMVKYAKEAGIVLPDEYMRAVGGSGARLKPHEEKAFVDGVWKERE